jgi:hypothetical protein
MALRFTNTPASKLPKPPPGWKDVREITAGRNLRNYLLKKSGQNGDLAKPIDEWPSGGNVGDGGPYTGRVCIIGAGAAGLYTAMMLKFLGIDFDIVEASDHVGGRCATHSFNGYGPDCPHNYYDMGAMRIPEIASMTPTLRLITSPSLLNIPHTLVDYEYNIHTEDGQGKRTDYDAPFCYWYQNQEKPKYVYQRWQHLHVKASCFC